MSEVISDVTFPQSGWSFAAPEDHDLKPDALARAADDVFAIHQRYGFLIVKNGRIVYERYARDAQATNHIYSITKGLGATLIGIAQHRGLLQVTDPIAGWLPVHHPDIASDAEIRHVLNMTAGRDPAGSWWQYNSNFILNSLPGILWHASGVTPVEFYNRYLKAPLQLDFNWPCNDKGWIQIGSQGPLPVIEATHRDIARLGHLWLNRGSWNGVQMMGQDFVNEALTPAYPQANGAYGYLWWLNSDQGTWRTTGGRSGSDGRWFPYAPSNVFMALGALGKVMIVVPDHNLIMVSMGHTPQEQSANYLDVMMRAVCDILPR